MKHIKRLVLGFDVDSLTIDETVALINKKIDDREMCQHVVINAGKVVQADQDPQLTDIINNCDIINADGMSIVWASRFLNSPLPERVAGIDLMHRLVSLSSEKGYKIYLFGAKEEVVLKVKETFQAQYPDLQVVGYRNGYYAAEDEKDIVSHMKQSNADILFVGFSSPQKEKFLNKYMSQMGIPFCMGVGGSFDVVAGITKRAPVWMQNMGLEWFYRFMQEPRRMWKRYLVGNFKFCIIVLREKINGGKR